ncbi:MAG: GspH/FimT family pseudopilin [Nitrospirae bacterium]|nr:GspH/FimT family pseudopilin [Nitrospirota bacterium]
MSRIFSRPHTSGQQGFSMAELLIVLGILSVLSLIGGSWLSTQIPHYQLNGAVRQVRADLLAARMQAVSQGNEFRVLFVDEEHYDILDDDNNNGKADSGELVEHRSILEDYAGVTVHSNRNPIFHPRGTASSLGTVTIANQVGEKSITISITGQVKVKLPQ